MVSLPQLPYVSLSAVVIHLASKISIGLSLLALPIGMAFVFCAYKYYILYQKNEGGIRPNRWRTAALVLFALLFILEFIIKPSLT